MTTETPNDTPKHEYETVEGTPAQPYVEHEPRTMEHRVVTLDNTDLHMMTEIGDGTFVQWSSCRKCGKRVDTCTCPGGPTEPDYMKRWRDRRFGQDLNARPDPERPILESVMQWVREHGYVIGKADIANDLFVRLFEAVAACEAPEGTQVDDVLVEFQEAYLQATGRTLVYQGGEVIGHTYSPPEGMEDAVVIDDLSGKMAEVVERVAAAAQDDEPDEDDIDFARDTLGPEATDDEVTDLANQRVDTRNLEQFNADF